VDLLGVIAIVAVIILVGSAVHTIVTRKHK